MRNNNCIHLERNDKSVIPEVIFVIYSGTMAPTERRKSWHSRRVFFLTPQVLTNDLSRGTCPADLINFCLYSGTMAPTERRKSWHGRRVFFLTPQVLTNDLSRGTCPADLIKCLVVDEAHKAQGNHAYCQVREWMNTALIEWESFPP